MTKVEFSEQQIQQALDRLQEFEQHYLCDPVMGFNNPFRRPGVPVQELAYACELLKEGTTASGRIRADMAAARRLTKLLLSQKLIESTGSHRTLSAGSSTVECFALVGFGARLQAAQDAWLQQAVKR